MKRKTWLYPLAFAMTTILFAGCGDSGTNTTNSATLDSTPSIVNSTSPANGATDVAVNSAIAATFSEAMNAATLNATTFMVSNGTSNISGEIVCNGATAIFTPPGNLEYSRTYAATITGDGVKDMAGNGMASDYSWSFTTGTAPDTTAPTVSVTDPANGTTDIAIRNSITAIFSEAMNALTINASTFTLSNGTSNIEAIVSYADMTATFTPTSSLEYSKTYTATITDGVKDMAANSMASDYSWSFTTEDPPPGSLDTTFGAGGIVTTDIGAGYNSALSLALQADGKIVAAGYYSLGGSNYDFALVRYNTNGALDASFGTSGKVTLAIGSSDDCAAAVAIQPDGKIVGAGYTNNDGNYDIAVVRYLP